MVSPRMLFCLGMFGLAGCASVPSPTESSAIISEACPIVASENWAAWINGMPGPKSSATLMVTGDVMIPSSGYELELIAGRADRSMRPVQQFNLLVTPPTRSEVPSLQSAQARFEGTAIAPNYKGVTILCGGEVIAELTNIDRIY